MRLSEIYEDMSQKGYAVRIASYFAALGVGYLVTFKEIEDLCYGREENGGPLNMIETIKQHILKVRKNLKPEWELESVWGVGYILIRREAK